MMSDLSDLLRQDLVLQRVVATSRKNAILALVEALAPTAGLEARAVFDAVLMRERLSGTGVGEGVAIPHARVEGLARPVGAFARLETPLDFDAIDGRPADLVFLLLAPHDRGADHLKALARVSRYLRRAEIRDRLRAARGRDELYAVFTQALESDAA